MNAGCDDCQAQLLDHLYGLLGAAEAASLEAHLQACTSCAAARADAQKAQALFARAAKGHFPTITFAPPSDQPVTPARPAEPVDARGSVGRTLTRWAVAAGVLLAACGLAVPTAWDAADFLAARPNVERNAEAVAAARAGLDAAARVEQAARQAADARVAAADTAHTALVAAWVADEKRAADRAARQPFAVEVRGPAAAVPGAPNEYAVRVRDADGKPRRAAVTATVRAGDSKLFDQKYDPADAVTVRLPADLWAKLPAAAEAFLQVSAESDGATASLREPVRLLGPAYATFLTTDKPLYRPGEVVYFRSTTLDRTRLLPPEGELVLRFELTGPDGKAVDQLTGLARVALPAAGTQVMADVLGPDGRPVRGVGCGGFALKPDAPGGTYTLTVSELPPPSLGAAGPAEPPRVLAERTVQVAGYSPDRLEKSLEFAGSSFAPGEPVQATVRVTDQGKPVAGAKLRAVAKADDQTPPVTADAVTAADGTAGVRFRLPPGDVRQATLSVTLSRDGVTETIVRPVPLAGRTLTVEFFPEGGDLVAGLSNRVYLRATTAGGRPADIAGAVFDGDREVCSVRTLRDADRPGANRGLGAFRFTPAAGRSYTLKLREPATAVVPAGGFVLPAAKPAGVVLLARDAATRPGEPVRVTLGFAGTKPADVLVGAYVRGRAIAHARAVLDPGKTTDVSLDPGPTPLGGVVRVTVFAQPDNDDGRADLVPLAERLVFRRPKELLALTATVDKATYLPGDAVKLDVTAKTEAGQPTPAVLWAAVVSRSVLSMADDKTERLLPTHFLLGGEVQQPDRLEHADFLLTDQPHAAEALDLVLGTQGWRRFAEQNPGEFVARAPAADRGRLLASLGAAPGFVRSDVQAVADRYWPRYEAAALALERAEAGRQAVGKLAEVQQAHDRYEQARAGLGRALETIDPADDRLTTRRWFLPLTLPLLGVGVVGLLLLRRRAVPDMRTGLLLGAVGLLVVAAFLLAGTLLTADLGAAWRQEAAGAPRDFNQQNWQSIPPAATPLPDPPKRGGDEIAPEVEGVEGGKEPPRGPKPPTPPPAPPEVAPKPVVNDGTATAPKPAGVRPAALPPAGNPDRRIVQRLQKTLNQQADPADVRGVEAVRANVPTGKPFVVRQYAHAPTPSTGPRTDFTETVLWRPVVVVPDTGAVALDFRLSDATTGYRVLVAGHTPDGRLGAVTETLTVRPPLSVDAKLPREVSTADTLTVPLVVRNGTDRPAVATVKLAADGLTLDGAAGRGLELPAAGGDRSTVRLSPAAAGPAGLTATVEAGGRTDAVRRTLLVVPDGFPVTGSQSGRLAPKLSATVSLPGDRAGGSRVGVTVYPNALSGVVGGLDGLLKEPHGCFEQTSSANYPNVLALDYLRATDAVAPAVAGRSRQLLDGGYQKLLGFECPDTPAAGKKGFEWFGAADRPHPALSAYGLLQFTDMARVYPVDPAVLLRTKTYLLSLRTGDGGFTHSTAALDRFGRAPDHVTDAYIVWAVSESERGGPPSDLATELDRLLARAAGESAGDPYFLALVGNAALNRGRTADGLKLLEAVVLKQAADGGVPGATAGITGSGPADLVTETTALAVLGWLKAERPDRFAGPVGKAVGFLLGKRQAGGAFGATQATVLALKALVEHARRNTAAPETGELRLLLGGKLVAKRTVHTDAAEPQTLDVPDADELLPPGTTAELTAETTLKQPVPATLTWSARTRQPATVADPPVTLACGLDLSVLNEGQTSRLTATVTNRTDRTTGMAVAVLGLPAGLTVPADGKQLRQLVADGTLDFWEVRGRELVLYWRGLDPKQARVLAVELVAEFPGEFHGPAGRAYLYYDPARTHWVPPLRAVVKPAG